MREFIMKKWGINGKNARKSEKCVKLFFCPTFLCNFTLEIFS